MKMMLLATLLMLGLANAAFAQTPGPEVPEVKSTVIKLGEYEGRFNGIGTTQWSDVNMRVLTEKTGEILVYRAGGCNRSHQPFTITSRVVEGQEEFFLDSSGGDGYYPTRTTPRPNGCWQSM